MNILATKLPLYQMRGFDNIIKQDNLILIDTYWDRYILDDTTLEGDMYDRRTYISLHLDEYEPYKLYPLSKYCTTIGQVISVIKDSKFFMDSQGNMLKYIPKKFYNIDTFEIKNIILKSYNLYLLTVKIDNFTHINLLSPVVGDYVQLIDFKDKGFILYDVSNEIVPRFRRKL